MLIESSLDTVSSLIGRHLFDGKATRKEGGAWSVDVSGRCQHPVFHDLVGRGSPVLPSNQDPRPYMGVKTLFTDLVVRCRKCVWCLRQRANEWATRARREVSRLGRSWHITLTLSPEAHDVMAWRARGTTFAKRHSEISKEITLWFKRLRKAGYRFRYILVVEPHEGERSKDGHRGANYGMPHYHLLLHETGAGEAIPMEKRPFVHPRSHKVTYHWRGPLHDEWRYKDALGEWHSMGWVDAKPVEELRDKRGNRIDAAWYVCNYLMKTAAARVRASLRYGADLLEQSVRGRPEDVETERERVNSVARQRRDASPPNDVPQIQEVETLNEFQSYRISPMEVSQWLTFQWPTVEALRST